VTQAAWMQDWKRRAGIALCGPGPVLPCLTGYSGPCLYDACRLCGSAEAGFPFRDHYACKQRERQLSVRWRWIEGAQP